MSQYNKTVLTNAGLELAKRANAGQAKFGITRAVTSADDWSNKTVQDLEEVTTIPNIMQQGTIMDTDEVESNNSVIGVSLCFTNKNLNTGYQIRIIGLYVKEEGQENDFLYAVTTAITPEYMPSFADKVLYRFNTQMYLVIGNAQSVNVVINEGTAVTSTQFNKYKGEVADNLKKLENTHKEDMSHVAKSASINDGAEILPDSTGKLNLVVPDPDLSRYVSLEQLTEMLQAKADVADVNKQIKDVTDLANTKANTVDVDSKIKTVTDLANTKANSADVYTKTETDNQINKFDLSKVKFHKQYINGDGQTADKTWSATKNDDGTYTIDLYNDDWTAAKLHDVLTQLPNKADTSTVNAQIADTKNTIKSNVDNLQSAINTKANTSDVYTKSQTDGKLGQKITFVKCDSPQAAYDASTKPAADGSIVFGIYDMNDEPSEAYVAGQKINIEWLYNHFNDLQSTVNSGLATKANQSDLDSTNATVESQASEIASLKAQLNDAVNQISYIKANYIEGRRFAKSQEAQAVEWENANPQRIAFITDD